MSGRSSEELGKLLNVRSVDNYMGQGTGRFFEECHRGGSDLADFFGEEARFGNININYAALARGVASANHWHDVKKEVISVVEGRVFVIIQNPVTRDFYYQEADSGMKFKFPPSIAHAIYPTEESRIIEIAYPNFDRVLTEKDTHRLPPESSLVRLLPPEMLVSPR